jgi:uncharacterized protein
MTKHKALRFGFLAVVTMIASTLVLAAVTPISAANGDWEGNLDTGKGSLRVVLHISQSPDGKLTASLDSPDQNVTGIEIDPITYKQPDLHFAIDRLAASFDGKMNPNNSEISGEWKQSGLSLPLVFKHHSK